MVSVLLGPCGSALRAALNWATQEGRDFASVRPLHPDDVHLEVMTCLLQHPELEALTLAAAAKLLGFSQERLSALLASPSFERASALERLAGLGADGATLHMLLEKNLLEREDHLAGVAAVLGENRLPAVAWPSVMRVEDEVLGTWLRTIVELAERAPALPLLVFLTTERWKLLGSGPEMRWQAILRRGLIVIPEPDFPGIIAPDTARWVPGGGASSEVTSALREAKAAMEAVAHPAPHEEAVQRAKSTAEAYLYRVLEECDWATGRFRLNVQWTDGLTGRTYEIDFLDLRSRLALEIDGYYHFVHSDSYRRDRKKDRALQQNDFVILRFLAEDVVDDLEDILKTIRTFLAWREEETQP